MYPKVNIVQVALCSDASQAQLNLVTDLGFTQVVSFTSKLDNIPRLSNRWPQTKKHGELKSAVLWSKGFDLWFFDIIDYTEWRKVVAEPKILETTLHLDSLTSFWPASLDRSVVARQDVTLVKNISVASHR